MTESGEGIRYGKCVLLVRKQKLDNRPLKIISRIFVLKCAAGNDRHVFDFKLETILLLLVVIFRWKSQVIWKLIIILNETAKIEKTKTKKTTDKLFENLSNHKEIWCNYWVDWWLIFTKD